MKDDAPLPGSVPKKRRQIEQLTDLHIATWLGGDEITPSERRRLQEEKDRRKAEAKRGRLLVGLLVADEGLPKPQLDAAIHTLSGSGATAIIHPGVQQRLHSACKALGVPVDVRYGDGELGARVVAREADLIIAAPKESQVQPYATPGVWMRIGYARHRGVPVIVIMPNGAQLQEETV